MDRTIPAAVNSAMVEAEDALKCLKEDFELIQKQGSLNDAAQGDAVTPLDRAIMSLDDADAAKVRVTAGLALASLFYSMYQFVFFFSFILSFSLLFILYHVCSQHEVWWY